MAIVGSPNYRVGLIIARSQPFHNGHMKILADALMVCDEVVFSIRDYDTNYFSYDFNQQLFRMIFDIHPRVSFFGTKTDSNLGTPKHIISRTLDELAEARYNMPTHFFTHYDDWVNPAMESQLETTRISSLANHNSQEIYTSIMNGTDLWKEKVPYPLIDKISTYIATKNRNF